jgi:hypothetical protein
MLGLIAVCLARGAPASEWVGWDGLDVEVVMDVICVHWSEGGKPRRRCGLICKLEIVCCLTFFHH